MTKLVNNIIGVMSIVLTLEAMNIGQLFGMDLHTIVSIIGKSSSRNFFTQHWDEGKATYSTLAKNPELVKVAWTCIAKICSTRENSRKQGA